MRRYRWAIAAVVLVAFPSLAAAQVPVPQPLPAPEPEPVMIGTESHWIASGFVGSNFARHAEEANFDFGGSIGYLWRGMAGGEFMAGFSPNFELEPGRSALLLGDTPWINSYMANAIGALPLGVEGQWRPYVSGGLGALTLRSDVLVDDVDGLEISPDDSRFAGNIGAGLLAFMGNVGLRADIRYFRGFAADVALDPIETPAEEIGHQILSGLEFWRANVGLGFRW